ncbi:hypothetical protein RT21_19135 [Pseudomonas sp. 10B238]|uniref:ubiquinol-cytochrome C chaperone family protein n=1 Tax=Pseudomonas sp. 10B238 TaxID=1586417 RepID=UPI0006183652|nr:ubiquinol-cytochrome C chaperone family protein [Pseudomonas sp. 10B238]KJJ61590.1 hypothetical protein RT21_19135 [Pseudomonas sp. 10B238]MCH2341581.1 hypothetical protein [Pseudomonas sp.]
MVSDEDLIRDDQPLLVLLQSAEPADIHDLVSFMTDNGKGRLAMASEVRNTLVAARNANQYSRGELVLLIRELQHFGGNSVVNLVRRNGVPYAEIVSDVLRYVGGEAHGNEVAALELQVLDKLVRKQWSKMSEQERAAFARQYGNASGFAQLNLETLLASFRLDAGSAARLASAVGSCITPLMFEGALSWGATAVASRFAGLALGPLATAAGIQSAASEAYRVTVPCVAHIAYIRLKHLARLSAE